jgi:hypothetical protein
MDLPGRGGPAGLGTGTEGMRMEGITGIEAAGRPPGGVAPREPGGVEGGRPGGGAEEGRRSRGAGSAEATRGETSGGGA